VLSEIDIDSRGGPVQPRCPGDAGMPTVRPSQRASVSVRRPPRSGAHDRAAAPSSPTAMAIDDGLHARHAARNRDRVLGLLVRHDPPRADVSRRCADVDRTLGEKDRCGDASSTCPRPTARTASRCVVEVVGWSCSTRGRARGHDCARRAGRCRRRQSHRGRDEEERLRDHARRFAEGDDALTEARWEGRTVGTAGVAGHSAEPDRHASPNVDLAEHGRSAQQNPAGSEDVDSIAAERRRREKKVVKAIARRLSHRTTVYRGRSRGESDERAVERAWGSGVGHCKRESGIGCRESGTAHGVAVARHLTPDTRHKLQDHDPRLTFAVMSISGAPQSASITTPDDFPAQYDPAATNRDLPALEQSGCFTADFALAARRRRPRPYGILMPPRTSRPF